MRKQTAKRVAQLAALSLLVLSGFGTAANAAAVQYQYTIYGDVLSGDEVLPNVWNLTGGDVITASGQFTADLGTIGSETGTVTFGGGDSMTIDLLGGQSLTEADAFGAIELEFLNGDLIGFDYIDNGGNFNSLFMFFDDYDFLLGEWQSNTNLTVVPLPAAVWMFGSGLIGLLGWARRRK